MTPIFRRPDLVLCRYSSHKLNPLVHCLPNFHFNPFKKKIIVIKLDVFNNKKKRQFLSWLGQEFFSSNKYAYCLYLNVCVCLCICVCVYIYIYIYIHAVTMKNENILRIYFSCMIICQDSWG